MQNFHIVCATTKHDAKTVSVAKLSAVLVCSVLLFVVNMSVTLSVCMSVCLSAHISGVGSGCGVHRVQVHPKMSSHVFFSSL